MKDKIVSFNYQGERAVGKVIEEKNNVVNISMMSLAELGLKSVTIKAAEVTEEENAKNSTCQDFYDKLENGYFFDTQIQELKFLDESLKSQKLLKSLIEEAIKQSVFLEDLADFDYDTLFDSVIKNYQI